ncbi:hypothetical protein [Pseudidiomarina mangrovi]|uniref:hypothetical protein n=1 Tax=Pseudidiomarina mangrovi TaxID=2487133 RepID=UPI000FCBE13F|nr:hypothetical protein [Pseudidiomarina mangrovi]
MLNAKVSDVIAVTSEGNYPFDLRFTSKNRLSYSYSYSENDRSDIASGAHYVGPGIYLVFFNGVAITVGIMRGRAGITSSSHSNILESRWLRLLNRVTMRGMQTGFGKQRDTEQLKELLPSELYAYIEHMQLFEPSSRQFSDTGSVATRLDMKFASEHWQSTFQNATSDTVIEPFEFVYFQLSDCNYGYAEELILELEKALITAYEFPLIIQSGQSDKKLFSNQINEVTEQMESVLANRCQLRLALHLT